MTSAALPGHRQESPERGSDENSSSDDDDEASREEDARTTWESLVGGSKRAQQACTCGLIPCLCEPSSNDDAAPDPLPPPPPRPPAIEMITVNPSEACRKLLPLSLSKILKPHQIAGIQFMWSRAVSGDRGCVLADHMGLGKTLQLISVLWAYLEGTTDRTALVVAPAFVLPNWRAEIARWLPREDRSALRLKYFAPSENRKTRIATLKAWKKEGGALLVGYEMFRQLVTTASNGVASGDDATILETLCDPGLIILDEAHRLKEPKSQLYNSLAKVGTSKRILVSGYPVQNRLDEYFALVDFARPGVLGSYEDFKTYFERPIAEYVDNNEGGDGREALRRAVALDAALSDVVLRRGNEQLGTELPPRTDWIIHCEMSQTQRHLYQAFEVECCGDSISSSSLGELASYHTALAIVNHPDIIHQALLDEEHLLLDEDDDDLGGTRSQQRQHGARQALLGGWSAPEIVASERRSREERKARDDSRREKLRMKIAARFLSSEFDSLNADGGDISRWAKPVFDNGSYVAGLAEASGKATIAIALLSAIIARGERAVLFTQTLGTLDVLVKLLNDKHFKHERIDGATPLLKRNKIVDRFNREDRLTSDAVRTKRKRDADLNKEQPIDVLLMSIKAGGEGINLIGASRVILFDVCWNPCFDQQALCRAHRFGQRLPVYVYRLVGPKDTMEARVLNQQRRKELLVKQVTEIGSATNNSTTKLSLRTVFDRNTPFEVDDDEVLRQVVTKFGEKWIATLHESVSYDTQQNSSRSFLSDAEKQAAIEHYRLSK